MIRTPTGLAPSGIESAETIGKVKTGTVIRVKFSKVRNIKFHNKFFALVNFAYDHWEPGELQAPQWAGVVPERTKIGGGWYVNQKTNRRETMINRRYVVCSQIRYSNEDTGGVHQRIVNWRSWRPNPEGLMKSLVKTNPTTNSPGSWPYVEFVSVELSPRKESKKGEIK